MHQEVREIIWEIRCFYLKQLVLSVWLGFFHFLIGLKVALVQHMVAIGILN